MEFPQLHFVKFIEFMPKETLDFLFDFFFGGIFMSLQNQLHRKWEF